MKVRYLEIKNFRGIKSLSWYVQGDFNCLIGPGDTCKTTILTAMDYALSPRALSFDDADFFNQDVSQEILIQITLTDWDKDEPSIKKFFSENKFGQYKCGIDATGPLQEPQSDGQEAISISLRVDKSLDPQWSVVQGRDQNLGENKISIYAGDRSVLGISRIDVFSDFHFTWGRNTILTRLSKENQEDLNRIVSQIARVARQSDISMDQGILECQAIADTVKTESQNLGVRLGNLSPRIDIQKQSTSAGAVSLHEDTVPLRNKGSGSKKLISFAMQMKLLDGKNVSLIDEIEIGLEPHRVRGLIYKLKNSPQQIFTTTHSPVVIRELNVADNELYVCKRTPDGIVSLESAAIVPDIQGPMRTNAEAFLGKKIVVCEGATEIGCLRAFDQFAFSNTAVPVWCLATCYYDARGVSNIKPAALKLASLGYSVAVFCDNDEPQQFSGTDKTELEQANIKVIQWDEGNSTEQQIFYDIPWDHISDFIEVIIDNRDFLEIKNLINAVKSKLQDSESLSSDPSEWPESEFLRTALGKAAKEHRVNDKDKGWIKRIDCAEKAFEFLLPKLAQATSTRTKLKDLWDWIQHDG